MPIDDKEKKHQDMLIDIVRKAIERDDALRAKYEVGDKFRFVRERLKAVLTQLESEFMEVKAVEKKREVRLAEGEVAVYVHLFNTKGVVFRSWLNMLTPKVFYEYSVNRPIYTELAHVLALLKSKSEKQQHAYLTIAVKSTDIIKTVQKDVNDNPTVKVREGSLLPNKLISFTHNGQDYFLNEAGELEKIQQ